MRKLQSRNRINKLSHHSSKMFEFFNKKITIAVVLLVEGVSREPS